MTDTFLRTKLHPPYTRQEIVARLRLQEQLAEGLRRPLTLVTAPAGFGKTTLVASWVSRSGLPAAWLSLDKNDNQIGRFLGYLLAALQTVDGSIGVKAARLLRAGEQVPQEAVLTSLVNDLDASSKEVVLVLDDYHCIRNQAVHAAVAFLLEHCPLKFHLLISTRSDPQLPLGRLRARGYLLDLRATDLRFTGPEAAQFLNEVMDLRLDSGAIAALTARTEGWAAGLQMAALSMRDREDVEGFITGFSGTNRYILDYLLEEVMAGQPEEIQRFMLYTSILERLTAPLCAALLAGDGEARPVGADRPPELELPGGSQSTSILEYLERGNLFLVPLDEDRQWYRYHQLFADLLRAQLQKSLGEPGVAHLHLRASAWHEQNGLILEAIQHASSAVDDALVERLIKQNYLDMMNRDEMAKVRFWMGNLSPELVRRRPWLCLYAAMNHSWFGQLDEASLLLDEAERLLQAEGASPDAQSMLGYHAYVKSRVTAMQGDTRSAIEYCHTARATVPVDRLDLQIDYSISLGYQYFLYGDFSNAENILNETIRLGQSARAVNNPVAAYCLLARAEFYQGRLHSANELLQTAVHLMDAAGGQYLGAIGLVDVEAARVLAEWNDLDAAIERLQRGLDYLPWWGKADDFCLAYLTLARVQSARGDQAEAFAAVDKAAQLIQTCGVFSEARSGVEAAQVKSWLAQGDWPAVDRWMAALAERIDPQSSFRFEDELSHITRARVLIARDKPRAALALLTDLAESARSGGRQGRLIEILLLTAISQQALGDTGHAVRALADSLALAEPEGYVRIYLDEGRPMEDLLQACGRWVEGQLKAYAHKLLEAFSIAASGETAFSTAPWPSEALVEPLTGRELEVLELLADGLSNREIAEQLVLSEGTIKTHTHNLYSKLDVNSRTQAIVRAKELNLI